MIKVQFENKYNPVFNRNNMDIGHKRTLINVLNGIDEEIYAQESLSDGLYRNIMCLTLTPLILLAIYKYDKNLYKFIDQDLKKTLPKLIAATGLSSGVFGIYNFIRAKSSYKANLLGIDIAEEKLNNPKLFVPIDDKTNDEIRKTSEYNLYKNKHYSNNTDLLSDFKYESFSKFINTVPSKNIKSGVKSLKSGEYYKAIKKIDNDTQNYTKKTMAGLNLIFAGFSIAAGAITYLITEILQRSHAKSKWLNLLTLFPAVLLTCNIGYSTHRSLLKDVEMVSRCKAKGDFLKDAENSKNFLTLAIDYLKKHGKYKKNIIKQNKLTHVRNAYLASRQVNEEQIEEAMQSKDLFFSSLKSKNIMKKVKRNKTENSYLKDFIINSSLPIFMYYMFKCVNGIASRPNAYECRPILKFIGVFGSATALNSLLSLSMIKGKRKK